MKNEFGRRHYLLCSTAKSDENHYSVDLHFLFKAKNNYYLKERWIIHKMVMVFWEKRHFFSNGFEVDDNDSAFFIQAILHS